VFQQNYKDIHLEITMVGLTERIKQKFREHIIIPLTESHAPVKEAAIGSAVGMFIGMTPTVGIQMWASLMAWMVAKYVFRVRFDLVIATAMVWLSNPLTMGPLYYGFLVTGAWFFGLIGLGEVTMTYSDFTQKLGDITGDAALSAFEKFLAGVHFLIFDLGYPMVIGSFFWATPLAIFAYLVTSKYLKIYRTRKANDLGLSYDEWKAKFERSV